MAFVNVQVVYLNTSYTREMKVSQTCLWHRCCVGVNLYDDANYVIRRTRCVWY